MSTPEITAEFLDEQERKARAATQGSWEPLQWCECDAAGDRWAAAGPMVGRDKDQAVADSEHIAANDPPTVLAMIERIRELSAKVVLGDAAERQLQGVIREQDAEIERLRGDPKQRWLDVAQQASDVRDKLLANLVEQARRDEREACLAIAHKTYREEAAGRSQSSRIYDAIRARGESRVAVDMGCHASRDGECYWSECPQERDGEPAKSGRHCPRDTGEDPYV